MPPGGLDFLVKKTFYHGLHPLPLPNHGKLLISWMVRLLVFQILGKLLGIVRLDLPKLSPNFQIAEPTSSPDGE